MNSTIRRALVRLAAMVIPVAAVACVSGVDQPLGNVGQIVQPIGSGGSGGSGNVTAAAVWKLKSFNGHTLPDTLMDTVIAVPDSSRTIIAVLDSAILRLDTTNLARETDYFQWSEARSSQFGGPSFNFTTIGGAISDSVPCGPAVYNDTLATQTTFTVAQMNCTTFAAFAFTRTPVQYTLAKDTLVGSANYQVYDSIAYVSFLPVYSNTATLIWKYFSAPTGQHTVSAPSGQVMQQRRVVIQRN